MLDLTAFVREHWKPLLVVLLAALFIWQLPAGLNLFRKNRLVNQQATILAARARVERADEAAQKESDSLKNFINGREYENNHQLEKNSIHARTLPAVLLPVKPPRER